MAIITIDYSKATPVKAVDYITSKACIVGSCNLLDVASDPSIPASLGYAQQMMATARMHQKAMEEDDRKYYHLKLSFDPRDRVENGGCLTDEMAMRIGMQLMDEIFHGGESVGGVHNDRAHMHFHGISNAVNLETGKMVDIRLEDYRRIKDRVQEICRENGLHDIDWREATRAKREREQDPEFPIQETFAEKGLQARGETSWKDDLRTIIDDAATRCSTMDEFREQLQANGVTLTRCTETTISYKLGDHKACRGDTLGADYTAAAIRDALEHNHEPELDRAGSVDNLIAGAQALAAGVKPLTLAERQVARNLGRLAAIPRREIDAMCDHAHLATWEEKQLIWGNCRAAKDDFWLEYSAQNLALRKQINDAYSQRRLAKECEWILDPRNRRSSLIGIVFAMIYLSTHRNVKQWDQTIDRLKHQQQQLRKAGSHFKAKSSDATGILRERGLTKDAYLKGVKELQTWADTIRMQNEEMLTPAELEKARREAEKQRQAQRQQAQTSKPDRKKIRDEVER